MHSANEEIRRTLDQLQHAIDQIQVREFNFNTTEPKYIECSFNCCLFTRLSAYLKNVAHHIQCANL